MSPECLRAYQFCPKRVRINVDYWLKKAFCTEKIYDYRFQCPVPKNDKSINRKDLQVAQKGDYKPAYKKYQKTAADQLQDLPNELAEIVAVWHDLPAHIKATIKALVQTAIQGDSR